MSAKQFIRGYEHLESVRMYRLEENKFKDDLPINTVNKIKEILKQHKLTPVESHWKNSVEGFYSLRVTIKGTTLATNGKGTTKEYAMASAYAELMERIQTQCPYRLAIDVSKDAQHYNGFYFAPDELPMSIRALLSKNDQWTDVQRQLLDHDVDFNELLQEWTGVAYEDFNSDFITIPYLNLMTHKLSHIPVKMVSKMYMSNGMCAGNTIEEALVQGISEVFERYVNRKIILEKISPPTFSKEELKKLPRILSMIERIEDKGNYKVIIKDCSLGMGYPVVGCIFINQDNQTYFVKFGSHPVIEIALERTLTELLQGQDVNHMLGVKEYSYIPPIFNPEQNIMGILVNGSGYYPSEFFSEHPSYSPRKIRNLDNYSNKELLAYLLNILYRKGHHVYVRDYSYLGLPTYQVIVPGFSEVESINDVKSIKHYSNFVEIKKAIRKVHQLSDIELRNLISLMDENNMEGNNSLPALLSLNFNGNTPWYYNSIDLFKSALCIKTKNFKRAYELLDQYLMFIEVSPSIQETYTYYKCVRDYIGMKSTNTSNDECIEELKKFYTESLIKDVIDRCQNPDEIFNQFGYMNCFNCKNCNFTNQCHYKNEDKAYKILKDANKNNLINQSHIISQLSFK